MQVFYQKNDKVFSMKQKEVLIIVPGAKYLSTRSSIVRSLILLFYKTTRILNPVYTNYAEEWSAKFKKENREVVWLRWNRGFTIWSRWSASKMLMREVLEYKKRGYKIQVVGISLGGDISLRVLDKIEDGYIDKIVLICSTNTQKKVKKTKTKLFNIYSPYDLFVRLATRVIAPISGGIILEGDSVENVCIENFSHDKFCSDDVIEVGKYKGKRITDIVKEFLE